MPGSRRVRQIEPPRRARVFARAVSAPRGNRTARSRIRAHRAAHPNGARSSRSTSGNRSRRATLLPAGGLPRNGLYTTLVRSARRTRIPALTCISHRTLRVALGRRLFSLPRRRSSRRMEREPLPQQVSARVPRRQPKRLRHEQLAQCRLKGDEKSGLSARQETTVPFRQDRSLTVAARNRVLSRDREGAVRVVIS